MSTPMVEKVANAVLYEGYLLYPYRSSAVKNRQRWNFGVVYPQAWSESQCDPWEMVTECLATGGPLTSLSIRIRCLRLVQRQVAFLPAPAPKLDEAALQPAASVELDGQIYESWQEAAECEITVPVSHFAELEASPVHKRFSLAATRAIEPLRAFSGMFAGAIVRTQAPLECSVDASLEQVRDGLFRIRIRISNTSPLAPAADRETAIARSLLSAHTILQVHGGDFVSLLEPPPEYQEEAAACKNAGTWPVLVGEAGERHTLLSSPIILYDYPQVAPESPGDLFDGAEIDEILSLRILTMTDDEKDAMRRSDDRARRILERTETLPLEHFMKLHGALRALDPAGRETS